MAKKNSIVVGLDIGTSKVCAVVGEMTEHGVEIIGIGSHPSQGLRKGVVINIEATVNSLKKAIEEAGLMAGCEIHTVFTSISGGHIKAFNSHGIVAVKNKEVAAARSRAGDRRGQGGGDPDGSRSAPRAAAGLHHRRSGRHQGAARHVRRAPRSEGSHRHRRGDLGAKHHQVLQPQRASTSPRSSWRRWRRPKPVLTDEERELGVVLVDMGGGTTDIAVYHDGTVKHTAVIGDRRQSCHQRYRRRPAHAVQRRRAAQAALWLRQRRAWSTEDERVEVPSIAGKGAGTVSRQILCEIIEPRLDEIFELVQKEIAKSGFEGALASGIVVTGGSMLLPGAVEMAERSFGMPVRLGVPAHVGGLHRCHQQPGLRGGGRFGRCTA